MWSLWSLFMSSCKKIAVTYSSIKFKCFKYRCWQYFNRGFKQFRNSFQIYHDCYHEATGNLFLVNIASTKYPEYGHNCCREWEWCPCMVVNDGSMFDSYKQHTMIIWFISERVMGRQAWGTDVFRYYCFTMVFFTNHNIIRWCSCSTIFFLTTSSGT